MPLQKNSIDYIEQLFLKKGHLEYSGEGVSQLEHALQCAMLAQEAGASNSLIIGAFLHDLGHLLNPRGETPTLHGIDDRHQNIASHYLQNIFSNAVVAPIHLHVMAKRALCTINSSYYDMLSNDSKRSLQLQGGLLEAEALKNFLLMPFAQDAMLLRRWDDSAKIPQSKTPSLSHFMQLAATVQNLC